MKRFYCNGELVKTSKNKTYSYGFVAKSGLCLKCSENWLPLETIRQKRVQELKEAICWFSCRLKEFEVGKEDAWIESYKSQLEVCYNEIEYYSNPNNCIIPLVEA